jgi:hypothetical protein
MDTLLPGTLTLPWRVHCAGANVQRRSACGNHSGLIVKTIPGYCEKPFAFPPESLFTFSPESRSPSLRNVFYVQHGIAFTLPRNPHLSRICSFKVSNDPQFAEKLEAIVGLLFYIA